MCIICVLWNKELITTKEAKVAAFEMANTDETNIDHLTELYDLLEKEEG